MERFKSKIILDDIARIIQKLGDKIERLENKSFLITGANGMLPSYMVYVLTRLNDIYFKDKCKIYVLTRNKILDNDRLGYSLKRDDVVQITVDVSQPFTFNYPVDFIIHAASKASPKHYLQHRLDTIFANVNGTIILLEYARKNPIESFLYFSSAEIYGTPDINNIPTPEDYIGRVSHLNNRSCYVESKKFAETLCMNYFWEFGIPVKIVRPSHIFGPEISLDDGRVIADFINNGLNGQNIKLLSRGTATRTFCDLSDATIAFFLVLLADYNGEVFNIGNDSGEISMKSLAEMMVKLFDYKIKVEMPEKEQTDYIVESPERSCVSIDKIRKKLGYNPEITLEECLKKIIAYHKEKM